MDFDEDTLRAIIITADSVIFRVTAFIMYLLRLHQWKLRTRSSRTSASCQMRSERCYKSVTAPGLIGLGSGKY